MKCGLKYCSDFLFLVRESRKVAVIHVSRVRQSYPDEAQDINDREQEIMKMWKTLTVSWDCSGFLCRYVKFQDKLFVPLLCEYYIMTVGLSSYRPRHWCTGRTPLVTSRSTCWVKALCLGIPSAQWSCTILHHWRAATCLDSRPTSHLAFGRQQRLIFCSHLYRERAFRIAAPRTWNSLPSDVKKADTVIKIVKEFPVLQTLRRHLIFFLFCTSYASSWLWLWLVILR